MKAATIYETYSHHMPPESANPMQEGQTARQAVKALRRAGHREFGDIGTATAYLSDGTTIDVVLQPTSDGGELMASQIIRRGKAGEKPGRSLKW